MSASKKGFTQDLPPKGGYAPFEIARTKLRTIFTGRLSMGIFFAVNIFGFPLYYQTWKENKQNIIEAKSQELATLPILYAERDRTLLKHMKRLRNIEDDVMKDFPYWEVGTLFGTKIYESLPEDTYVEPTSLELYTYTSPKDYPLYYYSYMIT
ncbi:NADH dehydrogenase [ubiquinone] 1 alpha subcomplex subunit 13 [Apis dorsata]|uniref:NADH dehydrogenase [ubiquinone] 1 alpha subcomplex subunit 13 n=1 Tax=Apis dorsata TaxID=7462 RepID=UPI0003DF7202|nr:NADH dehydrogenase [ubiquinone] 1 alpha subcomplex subunit 13 [Apis dorsata]